jgi:peptidoglycan/xylan/chitin deacetylase (PgdA/CDA1 family)
MKLKIIVGLCLLFVILIAGVQGAVLLKPAPAPILPDARLVCLFFDDGWVNQCEVALPILLEHDFKATFGVITGRIGTGHGVWRYMGEKELRELAEYGMDIAGHTKTHPNLTDNLTDKRLREEIIDSKKHLEKMGFEVSTFVYPYYEWDERVVELVTEAGYTCARSGWLEGEFYDLTTSDPRAKYYIPSWAIVNQSMERFKFLVNKANRHAAVCLTYHFISDTGPEETSTPVAKFKAQMSYLKEAGFTVVLLPELIGQ